MFLESVIDFLQIISILSKYLMYVLPHYSIYVQEKLFFSLEEKKGGNFVTT